MPNQEYGCCTPINNENPFPIRTAAILFFLLIPIFDMANGIIVAKLGSGMVSLALKLLVFPIAILFCISRFSIPTSLLKWLLVPALILILFTLFRNIQRSPRLILDDLFYLARGPILFSACYFVLRYLSFNTVNFIKKWFFLLSWLTMGMSIMLAAFFGFGLATHEGHEGVKGFYVAGNELTLLLCLAWWFVLHEWASSLLFRSVITSITFVLLILLATKSGPLIMFLLLGWTILHWIRIKPRIAIFLTVAISALAIYFAEDLFLYFGPMHPSWTRLQYFIGKFGVLEALTSGRLIFVREALTYVSDFGIWKWLFGDGFMVFWSKTRGVSIECDLVDLLGAGGLFLVGWFYALLLWGFWKATGPEMKGSYVHSGAILALLFFSIFVGHVSYATTPMIVLALILADARTHYSRQ